MQQATVVIQHKDGLHARLAFQFVKLARQFKSAISVSYRAKTVNAKSMVLLLALGANKDAEITFVAEGEDEQEAIAALVELVEGNFLEG